MELSHEERSAIVAGIREFEAEECKQTGLAPLTLFQRLALLNYIADRLGSLK